MTGNFDWAIWLGELNENQSISSPMVQTLCREPLVEPQSSADGQETAIRITEAIEMHDGYEVGRRCHLGGI